MAKKSSQFFVFLDVCKNVSYSRGAVDEINWLANNMLLSFVGVFSGDVGNGLCI